MPYLLIAVAAALWGTIGVTARVTLGHGLSPLEITFWRAVIGGACYIIHTAFARPPGIARRDLPAVAAFALVGITLFNWSFFKAVETGGAALAAVLLYTAPAWVALWGWLWMNQRLSAVAIAAMAVTLLGVGLVAFSGGGAVAITPVAIGWGLAAGLGYASYYLFGKRYFDRYSAALLFAIAMPIGALPLVPSARLDHFVAAWPPLLYLGIVPTYAAYLIYAAGLRRADATRAATVATIEPVVAAGLAFAFFGERLGPGGYAGAMLVVAGALMAGSRRAKADPRIAFD